MFRQFIEACEAASVASGAKSLGALAATGISIGEGASAAREGRAGAASSTDYKNTCNVADTLYAHTRVKLPYGLTVTGY
jgi:hypothetical protein